MLHKILLILMLSPLFVYAVGSDIVPSREAFIRFPTGGDDKVYGFAALDAGFSLANSSTSFTFASFMPVNTSGIFNGGTCELQEDLLCSSQFNIASSGVIEGNAHKIKFLPRDNSLTIPLGGIFTNLYSVSAGDDVYTVSWSANGQNVAAGTDGRPGANPELLVYNLAGTAVSTYNLGNVDVNHLQWEPGSNTYFVAGVATTPGLRSYSFTGGPTLTQVSTTEATQQIIAVSFQSSGNYVAAGRMTSGQGVAIYTYDGSGNLGAAPTATITGGGAIQRGALAWHPTTDYIAVGLDTTPFYLVLLYFDGMAITAPFADNIGYTISSVAWSSDGTLLAVGVVDTSASPQRLRIFEFEESPPSLTEITSYRIDEASTIYSLSWNSDDTMLALGRASGSGYEVNVYSHDSDGQRLIPVAGYNAGGSVFSVDWAPSTDYLASGDVTNNVAVNYFVANMNGFVFDTVDIQFGSSVTLQEPIHFINSCGVDGNGHYIDLNSQAINIDAGASLTLKNVTLKNVTGSNILCADSAGTLSCDNVLFELSGNFDFSEGQLKIIGNTKMTGEYSFTYSSDQNCTISSGAMWSFDSGMTFRYDPAGGANDLLVFEDNFALLQLYETTLYAPSTGLRFTKGTITVDGECTVTSDATSEAGGIWLGDGVSVTNNVDLNILPESGFVLSSGYMVHKNV